MVAVTGLPPHRTWAFKVRALCAPPLVPPVISRGAPRQATEFGEKWPVYLACDSDFHVNRRVLLHAANLRHGIDAFTSLPKEGMLWIFSPEKSDGFGRVRTPPSRNLLQWTIQLPTHHNNHANLRLYSAVCAPDDGCK
jgi:hypothetical protein